MPLARRSSRPTARRWLPTVRAGRGGRRYVLVAAADGTCWSRRPTVRAGRRGRRRMLVGAADGACWLARPTVRAGWRGRRCVLVGAADGACTDCALRPPRTRVLLPLCHGIGSATGRRSIRVTGCTRLPGWDPPPVAVVTRRAPQPPRTPVARAANPGHCRAHPSRREPRWPAPRSGPRREAGVLSPACRSSAPSWRVPG
jgi:hypothetical protein